MRGKARELPELVKLVESRCGRGAAQDSDRSAGRIDYRASALAPLPSEQDRYYLDRFVEFVKEWEQQERRENSCGDFIEYLNFFTKRAETFTWKKSSPTMPCS